MKKEKTRAPFITEFAHHLENVGIAFGDVLQAVLSNEDSLLLTDKSGTVIYANPAWEKMSGYSGAEVIGQSLLVGNSGLQSVKFYQSAWKTLNQGSTFHGVFLNRKKNGLLYYQSTKIVPIFNSQKKIVLFLSLSHDATSQYYREKKLALIGQLAAPFFKELHQPLALIQGAAWRLRSFAKGANKVSVYRDLEKIYETGQELSVVVDTLHNFLDEGAKQQPVKLNDLVELINRRLSREYQAGKIKFKLSAAKNIPSLVINKSAWEFALAELLRLAMAALAKQKDKSLLLALKVKDSNLILTIEHAAKSSLMESLLENGKEKGLDNPQLKIQLIEKIVYDERGLILFAHQGNQATTTIILPLASGQGYGQV